MYSLESGRSDHLPVYQEHRSWRHVQSIPCGPEQI